MKKRAFGWGWLTLSLGILTLILTYASESYTWFCWGWLLCAGSIAWLALCKLPCGLTQWLLVGAAFLNVAAGFCNGLVMAANGGRMPVEQRYESDTRAFLDSEEDRHGFLCGFLTATDDSIAPQTDSRMHFDVPMPHVVRGTPAPFTSPPRLDFLDDRHSLRVCGEPLIYSKGDMMGFIGTVELGVPGLILLALGFLWRRIFPKRDAPT